VGSVSWRDKLLVVNEARNSQTPCRLAIKFATESNAGGIRPHTRACALNRTSCCSPRKRRRPRERRRSRATLLAVNLLVQLECDRWGKHQFAPVQGHHEVRAGLTVACTIQQRVGGTGETMPAGTFDGKPIVMVQIDELARPEFHRACRRIITDRPE